jgi:hypothetical protein
MSTGRLVKLSRRAQQAAKAEAVKTERAGPQAFNPIRGIEKLKARLTRR